MRTPSPQIEVDAPSGDGPVAAGHPFPGEPTDPERREMASRALWNGIAALYARRWLIALVTAAAAIGSIVYSLSLPNTFSSTTRVLPPEGGSNSGLGAIIGNLSPVASSLLGGGSGDYGRYLAILSSRSMRDSVLSRFELVDVYNTSDKPDPVGAALKQLDENTLTEVDMEDDALSISVFDESPRRAAQIANFYVAELNRRNEALGLESATTFRSYVEGRYREIEARMDSAQSAMTAFQKRTGVIELPAMAQGMIEAAATQQAEISKAEIYYESLQAELGPENPQVIAAKRAFDVARQSQANLLAGREAVMPLGMSQLPAAAGQYARLTQELLVQKALMEQARPLLEQARFDEERDRVAVQVLDPAMPAVRKARPKRAFIVVAATISAFALTSLLVLLMSTFRRQQAALAEAFARARSEVG